MSTAPTTKATNGFATPVPVFEWDDADTWSGVLNIADTKRFGEISEHLYKCELAYRTANLEEVFRLAEELTSPENDEAVRLSATCTRFLAYIAAADPDGAYKDLRDLYVMCSEGLQSDDLPLRGTACMCAMRIEDVLMARIFDIPRIKDGMDDVVGGLKAYMGYLLALREIRNYNFQKASGIAFAVRKLMGPHYPLSNIGLLLVSASAALVSGDLEEAEREYIEAVKIGKDKGIVMPFVEINFLLMGLPRRCADTIGRERFKRIEKLVNDYREGWFGVRRKCGLTDFGSNLTLLEMSVTALTAMGWRNKEIATHLNLAETTVKHQLSSVYQKLGLSKRAELRKFAEPATYESVLTL